MVKLLEITECSPVKATINDDHFWNQCTYGFSDPNNSTVRLDIKLWLLQKIEIFLSGVCIIKIRTT